jgi:hypothetical protein
VIVDKAETAAQSQEICADVAAAADGDHDYGGDHDSHENNQRKDCDDNDLQQ